MVIAVRRCVCDRVERIHGWQRSREGRTKRSRNVVPRKRELMSGRVVKETMEESREARMAPRAAHLIGTVTQTKDPMGAKAKVKARAKLDIAKLVESRDTLE